MFDLTKTKYLGYLKIKFRNFRKITPSLRFITKIRKIYFDLVKVLEFENLKLHWTHTQ